MHREVAQVKFLRARTLYRAYYHVTSSMVLDDGPGREREVDTLPGIVILVHTTYTPHTHHIHTQATYREHIILNTDLKFS